MPFKKHKPEEIMGKLREAEISNASLHDTLTGAIPIRCGKRMVA